MLYHENLCIDNLKWEKNTHSLSVQVPGLVSSLVLFKSIIWFGHFPPSSIDPRKNMQSWFWKHKTNNREARGWSEREPLVATIIPPMKISTWKTKPTVMRGVKWVKRTKCDSGTTIRWRFGRRDAGQTQGRRPGQWQTVFLFASFQGFCRDNTWKIPGQYLEKAGKHPGRNTENTLTLPDS